MDLTPSWFNLLKPGNNSLQNLVKESGSSELENVLKHIDKITFSLEKTADKQSYSLLLQELTLMRRNYFKQQTKKHTLTIKNGKWLNPTASD